MSDVIATAVAELNSKLEGTDFAGTAKFVMTGVGSIVMDGDGARASDDEADVTLTADLDTFQEIFEGELNPTAAFMGGKLTIDGDMGMAMQLATVLS